MFAARSVKQPVNHPRLGVHAVHYRARRSEARETCHPSHIGRLARRETAEGPRKTDESYTVGMQESEGDWLDLPDAERQRLTEAADTYLAELEAKVGKPSKRHQRRARRLVRRLDKGTTRRRGGSA